MYEVNKIRNDFPMLQGKTMQGHPLVYFDNAATTFKPNVVIDTITQYYRNITSSVHRGDYDLSYQVSELYENARKSVADFIHAEPREIVFTSGTSSALNQIIYGLSESFLQPGDEILVSEAEHASNLLPWFQVAKQKQLVVKYIPLTEEGRLTPESVRQSITPFTKVISIAHVTNVLGFIVDIAEIVRIAHENEIYVVVDGAQSAPHIPLDMKKLNCDFYCFSAHKMCGPTGIGVLYGKYELLEALPPLLLGGGMNTRFSACGEYHLQKAPYKFEAGTPNIEGALGFAAAISYLQRIGMYEIARYEHELRTYAIEQLKTIPGITIYNESAETGILTFNLQGVFSQDAATHFNAHGIAVRAGQHCAKILPDFLKTVGTVRASLYFYNTKEEVDYMVLVARKGGDFLNAYFQ